MKPDTHIATTLTNSMILWQDGHITATVYYRNFTDRTEGENVRITLQPEQVIKVLFMFSADDLETLGVKLGGAWTAEQSRAYYAGLRGGYDWVAHSVLFGDVGVIGRLQLSPELTQQTARQMYLTIPSEDRAEIDSDWYQRGWAQGKYLSLLNQILEKHLDLEQAKQAAETVPNDPILYGDWLWERIKPAPAPEPAYTPENDYEDPCADLPF